MQEILCLRQSIIRGRSTPTSNYCLIITVHDLPLLLFIALHNRLHMIKVPLRDTWTCRTLCLEAMFCVWFNFVMLSHIGIETLPLVHIHEVEVLLISSWPGHLCTSSTTLVHYSSYFGKPKTTLPPRLARLHHGSSANLLRSNFECLAVPKRTSPSVFPTRRDT